MQLPQIWALREVLSDYDKENLDIVGAIKGIDGLKNGS